MFRRLRVKKRGPLKTPVSRKTAFEDISHREKMSPMNLLQTNGLIGLPSRNRFLKSPT